MATIRPRNAKQHFEVHQDELDGEESMDEEAQEMEESAQTVEEEDYELLSGDSSDTDEDVDPVVKEDIEKFQRSFKDIRQRFRLINRIGEGTFSTVYKAEDLLYDNYDNDWDLEETEVSKWASPPVKSRHRNALQDSEAYTTQRRRPRYVAIKKIYVTSSPSRIFNELELLNDLRGHPSVCPLITAFRDTDQVVAVLPYFRHTDFRNYFRKMTIPDMQIYFRSLFRALAATHSKGIIHRDIKPTNFLYEPSKKRGVLVDFGLAERQGTDSKRCLCNDHPSIRKRKIQDSISTAMGTSTGYPKNDPRPSRRANRAGTRGFRAPEVLFKCTSQTTSLDIWSAGVILLTILSKRFPFFNSADDIEAMIEIATIFGWRKMKSCANLHGTVFETSIPTIGEKGFTMEKIILWSTCRNDGGGKKGEKETPLSEGEKKAVAFLERCLELDCGKRITAVEALEHEFLREEGDGGMEETEDEEVEML